MSLEVLSAKITGTPSLSGWTQIHEFKPEDEEKLKARGHLFAVIATKRKEEGIDTVTAGRELLSRLHEEYYGNLEASAFSALKNSVEKVIKEFTLSWGEVEIATTVVLGDVVYSAAGGGAGVSIYRGGNIAKILESGKEETVSASGYPKEGDFIILGTNSFFQSIPHGVLKASIEGPDLESSIESLAPMVHSNPNSGNIGAVIIKFFKPSVIEEVQEAIAEPAPRETSANKIPNYIEKAGGLLTLSFKSIGKLLGKIIPEKRVYVKVKSFEDKVSGGRKTTFYVGAILLVLLFVSIGFGIKQNLTNKHRSTYQGSLNQAKDDLTQAENISGSDPTQARQLFLDGQAKINDLIARKIKDNDLTALNNEYKSKEAQILGIIRKDPDLYLDLGLLASGLKGDKVTASGNNLYVWDKDGKRVVSIAIDTKKTGVVAGPDQLDGATDIFAYEDTVYGVFSDGIYTLGQKKEKVITKDWKGEIIPYAYTGNIYLLDKEASLIWRYSGSNGSFGARTNWIAPGIKPDFGGAKSVIIDGTFWILSNPFDILRFSVGSPMTFNPTGVFPDLTNAQAIYTDENNKNLYILDKTNKRIVVLDKNGSYKAQYVSDRISEATGLIASETNSEIILLAGSKLYSLAITNQ